MTSSDVSTNRYIITSLCQVACARTCEGKEKESQKLWQLSQQSPCPLEE